LCSLGADGLGKSDVLDGRVHFNILEKIDLLDKKIH